MLVGDDLARYELNHERAGQVVLVSAPNSWQAYYWWLDDGRAPGFARTVDIHRKPGYDPVELHFDPATRSIPLDATRVKGSHGAPVREQWQQGVLLASQPRRAGRPADGRHRCVRSGAAAVWDLTRSQNRLAEGDSPRFAPRTPQNGAVPRGFVRSS